jgi:DNA-binding NarL/FixJ family response regulator
MKEVVTLEKNPNIFSRREIELLRLMAQGLTNTQIASRLYLSSNTVRALLFSICTKTGLASRSAAVRYAIENGLLDENDLAD